MYKDYYRLREEPFNITPDPRFLYFTAQHREALNHLLYGIRRRKGFTVLTGEVGTGKTTICRALLEELGGGYHTALILNPMLTETQLLRATLAEFGVQSKRLDRLGYLRLLNDYLLRINSAGRDAVLIIDEAQDMARRTLEMTRLLSNLETHRQKLLQIVLVGQPELRTKLRSPALRQLAQRITVRFHLGKMSPEETAGYLRYRMAVAGSIPTGGQQIIRFDPSAVREIYRFSKGTPRLVNAVGDKALLAGYVYRAGQIDKRLVRLAVEELREAG
ncbi:MAG: AAA family ATPase [Planctomycetota bacterium]|nr:AAA family ATPase [Planctomycetota bacterium]